MGLSLIYTSTSNAENCACFHRGGWQGNNTYYRCNQTSCFIKRIPDGSSGAVWTVDNTVNLKKQGVNYISQPDGSIACPKAYRHANPGIYLQCQSNKAAAKAEAERDGLPQCAYYKDWKSSDDGEYTCMLDTKTVFRCAYNFTTGLNINSAITLDVNCPTMQSSPTASECAKCYRPLLIYTSGGS